MAYGTVNADLMTTSDGVSASGTYGFKNRIINGAMVIDQRAGGTYTVPATTVTYGLDRWAAYNSQASKFTMQQSSTAPVGFNNSLLITSSAATTVGASDYYQLQQKIEGYNFADFNWGTANAKTVTLSFWVQSSLTGTFGGSFQNNGSSRNYPFSYTITTANTWQQISVTIAGDTTGTWIGATNGIGVIVSFSLGMGSSNTNTAGAWYGTYYGAPTSSVNLVATNAATFYITGVQLEKGSTATSFDYRPYGTELALCQRYHVGGANTSSSVEAGPNYVMYFSGLSYVSGQQVRVQLPMKVPMRASPAAQFSNNSQFGKCYFNAAGATISVYGNGPEYCSAVATCNGTSSNIDLAFGYALDAEL
jgi:hypothetical protein